MARLLKYEMKKGCLIVQLAGDFALDEAYDRFLEMLNLVDTHNTKKVLVDCLQVKGTPSVTERFSYAKFCVDELWKHAQTTKLGELQFAYVGVEPLIDKDEFGQMVATNRGIT